MKGISRGEKKSPICLCLNFCMAYILRNETKRNITVLKAVLNTLFLLNKFESDNDTDFGSSCLLIVADFYLFRKVVILLELLFCEMDSCSFNSAMQRH